MRYARCRSRPLPTAIVAVTADANDDILTEADCTRACQFGKRAGADHDPASARAERVHRVTRLARLAPARTKAHATESAKMA